jgi:hypothetical protein
MIGSHPSHNRRCKPIVAAPDEYMRQRRARRMDRTARIESQVQDWARRHGRTLRGLNDGHHWLFQKSGFVAEWWPSSAKLVLDRDYPRDFHAPHWADVERVLDRHLTSSQAPQTTQDTLL